MSAEQTRTATASEPSGVDVRARVANVSRTATRFALPQLCGVIILFAVGSALIDGFGSSGNIKSTLVIASFLGIAAGGETFPVLLGGIDLSIPSLIALGNVATPQLTGEHWPFWAILVLILALAAVIGAVNGLVSKRFEIHSLIVTLGMSAIVAGGLLVWTKGQATGAAPTWLSTFVAPITNTGPIPLPPVVVLWGAIALVGIIVANRTGAGRRLYATGANDRAAVLARVKTTRIWIGAFVVSAVLAAIAGIALAGFSSNGDLGIGTPYLFTAIAAVVVGGTSLRGARGGFGRVVFGALMLSEIQTILVGEGLSAAAQQTALGLIILVVVMVTGRERPLRDRI